ncbi:MAG: Re/Si-specific NAD(P)(+) transhydrogenase subunit alpha [Holosporales bacterium]
MKIAVLKESRPYEARVAATPETVKKMISRGLEVVVETGAGLASSFSDDAFKEAGAVIAKSTAAAVKDAAIILKVQRPEVGTAKKTSKSAEDEGSLSLPSGSLLIGMLAPHADHESLKAYARQKITTISLELVPRITRAQTMDVLSSQANLAGYRAVIEAASLYDKALPLMMTAAGTVAAAKVLILGAGVAGLQAIATARRLGAIVSAFDVRAAAKEQVLSLGATFIEVQSEETGEGTGGYAKEMSADYQKRQAEKITEAMAASDIVIGTALIPGKPAPKLMTEAMVKSMKPGSVIVDMATESGGNCEISEKDQIVEKYGVKIIGHSNLPSRIARDASALYARNVWNYLQLILTGDKPELHLNMADEIVAASVLTHGGEIVHPHFKGE